MPEGSFQPAPLYEPPFAGKAIAELGAVRSIVQVWVAAVGSTFPALSCARTSNVCEPAARLAYAFGEAQAPHEPPSRRHSKLTPPGPPENAKLGSWSFDGCAGPVSIDVSGGVVSTTNVRLAAASTLPARSRARTRIV